jgi:endonuclease III
MGMDANRDQRMGRIAQWLLEHRITKSQTTARKDWGEIADYTAKECPKKVANQFLLCCLLQYQINSRVGWENGLHYVKEISQCPDEVWREISDHTKEGWESKFKEYGLHWMHNAHNRLCPIAKCICFHYDGDARRIWEDGNSFDVLCRLYYIGAGAQISRMIVGALKDCGYVFGKCDVKADVYVCRVLGRAISGIDASPVNAIELSRQLYPSDPWQLDSPLWHIGESYCELTEPKCSECGLAENCLYAHEHASQ